MRTILSALVLAACGTTGGNMAEPVVQPKPTVSQDAGIDSLLLEAVQVWKEDCRQYSAGAFDCGALLRRVDSIRVSDKLDRGTLGTCRLSMFGNLVGTRDVLISDKVAQNPQGVRAVLAHEIGHCALLINHVNDDAHLMSPYILVDDTLEGRLPAMLQRFYAEAAAKILPRIL